MLVFYDDSEDFGGHEAMTLAAVRHLAVVEKKDVAFIFFSGNLKIAAELNFIKIQGGAINLIPIDYHSRRLQSVRTLFSFATIFKIFRILKKIRANVVIVAQGRIESCTVGLVAAKLAGCRTVSYIPMAHQVGGNFFSKIVKIFINSIYYNLADKFITISELMKNELLMRAPGQDIVIVRNGLDLENLTHQEKVGSRTKLGISEHDYVIAIIGRVSFKQKAHDFLVETLSRFKKDLGALRLMVVGDGPDLSKLKELVISYGLEDRIIFCSWSNDLSPVYAAVDALVIPSWYEGVPLVMLEGMYYELPIVATRLDGMLEMLPEKWLFSAGNSEELFSLLRNASNENIFDKNTLTENRNLILRDYSLPVFGANFTDAIYNN